MQWATGAADIDRLLHDGHLQAVRGAQADGRPWLAKARTTITTARAIAATDPDNGFVLAYDAVRQACTGLLVHQGLRPTTSGGHYAVEQAVRAQFGDRFKVFGGLRRRRNEIEYPMFPGEGLEQDEVLRALARAEELLDAAEQLIGHLAVF